MHHFAYHGLADGMPYRQSQGNSFGYYIFIASRNAQSKIVKKEALNQYFRINRNAF